MSDRKSPHWEDIILYTVIAALLSFLAWYFIYAADFVQKKIEVGDKEYKTATEYLFHLQAMKYEFATKALLSNAIRSNMSFMIGSFMCILATMIVVRRIRTETSTAAGDGSRSLSFSSNSAGISLAFLGTIMIILSITTKNKYDVGASDVDYYMMQQDSSKQNQNYDTTGRKINFTQH